MSGVTVKLSIALAAAVAALCVGVMASAAEPEQLTPAQRFVRQTAVGSLMEIELGRIAKSRGSEREVRDFGNRMIQDHTKALAQTQELAKQKGITVPESLDEKRQKAADKFKDVPASEFDARYITHMVRDHEKDLAEAENISKNAQDNDIAEFASRLVPVYRSHLDAARKIQRDLKLEDKGDAEHHKDKDEHEHAK